MCSYECITSRRVLSPTVVLIECPFLTVDAEHVLSPFVRVFRKSTKCVYDGSFLSGSVRCHLRMMAEGSFYVKSFKRTAFDVTGSPSFSNAWRFTLTVSIRSSIASGVSLVIFG